MRPCGLASRQPGAMDSATAALLAEAVAGMGFADFLRGDNNVSLAAGKPLQRRGKNGSKGRDDFGLPYSVLKCSLISPQVPCSGEYTTHESNGREYTCRLTARWLNSRGFITRCTGSAGSTAHGCEMFISTLLLGSSLHCPRSRSWCTRWKFSTCRRPIGTAIRSEEHTSELQSHSFISYAV